MNILIVANNYLQKSIISSKRWRCFADYLSHKDHNIWVVCGKYDGYKGEDYSIGELQKDNLHILQLENIGFFYTCLLKFIRLFRGHTDSPEMTGKFCVMEEEMFLQEMDRLHYLFYYLKTSASFFLYKRLCLSKLNRSKQICLLKNVKFDVIIASSGPLDSIIVGEAIKKKHPESIYLNEFRDMLHARRYLNRAMNDYYVRYEKRHVSKAHGTIVVSEGQKEMLCEAIGLPLDKSDNIHVLYHGFDLLCEDKTDQEQLEHSFLLISYTGTFDPNIEDPRMLFRAIEELIQEGKIELTKIKICCAGIGSELFKEMAENFLPDSMIKEYGLVDRKIALKIQRDSDLLLLLCHNNKYAKGMLSGKFSEYLASEKPIIGLTKGKLENAEITELISKLNVGIACEYVNEENELPMLKEYLLSQYQRKISGSSLLYKPDKSWVGQFDYKILTQELESILRKYSSSKN